MSIPGFERCLAVTWVPENDGQPFHRTPGDSGDGTAWAVTFAIYAAWERAHGRPWPSTTQFQSAAKADLAAILHAWFWLAVQGDSLPVGINLLAWECCVLSGQGRAARILQEAAGVETDGRLGPITLAAVQAADPAALAADFTRIYLAQLAAMPGASAFQAGWDRRVLADAALAQQWITTPATV